MIFYYKNSFLASLVSIFASGLAMMGILALLDKEILMGIVFLVISIPLFLLGKQISVRKSFKKWWKNLEESGVIAQAAASREVAIAVYQKNPTKQITEKAYQKQRVEFYAKNCNRFIEETGRAMGDDDIADFLDDKLDEL